MLSVRQLKPLKKEKLMSRAQLEKKYGISIVENGYFDRRGRYIRLYDMYSADGCCWDRGKRTIKEVAEECKVWEHSLLEIKRLSINFFGNRKKSS